MTTLPMLHKRSLHEADPLEDFAKREITLEGSTKVAYIAGRGPAVIVMTEMPGISPHVARFARWVRDAGLTVYMPSLFGKDGAVSTADEGAAVFQRACVSAEFRALEAGLSSPVTTWLKALARLAHHECGGPGVGAIGMCWTGNFALSMMLEPTVLAPVLCQPVLPLGDPSGLAISPAELATVRTRLEQEDLTVLAYRFEGDKFCRAQRFAAYEQALGSRFVGKVLPDSTANADVSPFFAQHVRTPHSVVTVHLIDEAGQPTLAARDEILAFFVERLNMSEQASQTSGHSMNNEVSAAACFAMDVAPRTKPSNYPEPFSSRMQGREKRQLGDVFGLSNFGVNLTRLPPNSVSALRHSHARQDEFIYILQGHPTLHTDEGRMPLAPGMCAGFKAGSGNAHNLLNETSAEVVYLEVGDRTPGDQGSYPDDDLMATLVNGLWQFTHKDGSPY